MPRGRGSCAVSLTLARNTNRCSACAMDAASPPRNSSSKASSARRASWNNASTRPCASNHALNCHCPTASAWTLLLNWVCANAVASAPSIDRVCAEYGVVIVGRGEGESSGKQVWLTRGMCQLRPSLAGGPGPASLSDDRAGVKVVLHLRKYYAFTAFTYHVRYVLPTKVLAEFRSYGTSDRACCSGYGQ